MKARLKFLLAALALGLMAPAPALLAQDAPPPGQRGQRGGGRGGMLTVERIEQAVGKLTDDQKAKITAILEKSQKERQALSQEERRTKGREIMQQEMKDIRALLTEEQAKKFDEMAPGRGGRQGGGGRRQGGGNGGGGGN